MTKKKAKATQSPAKTEKSWSPGRVMGLARALQKAGYGTRRQAETLIGMGRVIVDQEICEDPRSMVGPQSLIKLDGKPLIHVPKVYFAFHKPAWVVCNRKEGDRKRLVEDYLPRDIHGLNPSGRMDGKTTGLLLVSNDLAWNNSIATAGDIEQEYRVQLRGELSDLELDVIGHGIQVPKLGLFRPASLKIVEIMNGRTILNIAIGEGKMRQMRRMFATLRYPITIMRRIRIGEIRLGDLYVGGLRPLTDKEVDIVRQVASEAGEVSAVGKRG